MRLAVLFLLAQLLVSAAAAQSTVRIKLGHVLADTHSWQLAAIGFAEDVEAGTEGRVKVDVFPYGQLGNEKELIEGLQLGTVQAGVIGSGSFQIVEPQLGILEMPYAWPSRESAFAALDGELGAALGSLLRRRGIEILAWWENGYRHLTTSGRAVATPPDLAGLKVRVTPDKVRFDTFRALGAEPAPLAFNELYSALQQRVIDAQENPLSVIYSSSLYEVQSRLVLTGHNWSGAALVISTTTLDRLAEADRETLRRLARKWAAAQREMIAAEDVDLRQLLAQKGMSVDVVDTAPFRAASASVWEAHRAEYAPEIIVLFERYRASPAP